MAGRAKRSIFERRLWFPLRTLTGEVRLYIILSLERTLRMSAVTAAVMEVDSLLPLDGGRDSHSLYPSRLNTPKKPIDIKDPSDLLQ